MKPLHRSCDVSRSRIACAAMACGLSVVFGAVEARADGPSASPAPPAASAVPPLPPPPPPTSSEAPASAPPPSPGVAAPTPGYTPPAPGYAPPGYPPPPPGYVPPDYSNRPLMITDWPEDEPAPAGYHWAKRVRKGPIIAGSVLFGSVYLLNVLIGAAGQTAGQSAFEWLYVPAIGPFIEISNSSSPIGTVSLIIDGAAGSAGLALLIWGLTSPASVLLRNQIGTPRVMPVPMVLGRNGSGMGVVGTF